MIVQIVISIGALLILIGLWGLLTRQNLIKIFSGFSIMDTGTHLVIVGLGYRKGATAPILDSSVTPGTSFRGSGTVGSGSDRHRHRTGCNCPDAGLCGKTLWFQGNRGY